ncbi:MAG TPA: glycosyltransferase 87 family protein [Ktedonobacterales bacterium]
MSLTADRPRVPGNGAPANPPNPPRWAALVAQARRPSSIQALTVGVWLLTRAALLAGVILGHRYGDPQFYKYAGDFAAGQWPYRDVSVEYPPLAMALLLLPALPLLPFSSIAPRPDAAFNPPIVHLPTPDPVRYGAYGVSFAVEMLLIDALTLWLVMRAARQFTRNETVRATAGLLYTLLAFLSGAILQKFDLAVGALLLAAVVALVSRRRGLAWMLLGVAAMVKGFPIFAAPAFALYELELTGRTHLREAARAARRPLAIGVGALAGTLAAVTLAVIAFAGWAPVLHSVATQAGRDTEIESLYGGVALGLGWAPGLAVKTAFHPVSLSRVVLSPLTAPQVIGPLSTALLGVALLAVYLVMWRAWQARVAQRVGASESRWRANQALALGVTLVTLAFTLTFRALPSHYLLDFLPLIPLLEAPSLRRMALWLGAIIGAAILGQIVTIPSVWAAIVALQAPAVALLILRNALWIVASATLVAALWHEAHAPVAHSADQETPMIVKERRKPLTTRAYERWRRLLKSAPPIPGFQPRAEDIFAHVFSQVSPIAALLGAGLVSIICYLGLTFSFPIVIYWNQPHITPESSQIKDMGAITHYSPLAAIAFVVVVIFLFGAQFVALLAASRAQREESERPDIARRARQLVFIAPVVFSLILIWMQPVTTTDLYGYIARGYLYTHLHQNPMVNPAYKLPGGFAVDRPASPYGPAWLMVTALFSWISNENLLVNMLLYKVFAALFIVIAMALIDQLARRLYPERRLRIAALFGWSPLLLFESVGAGHNDIVMMVCVLAAFALMLRGRAQLAFAFLTLGALIKYVSAFFVPLWLVYELRHRALTSVRPAPSRPATGFQQRIGSFARSVRHMLNELDGGATMRLLAETLFIGLALVVLFYAPFWEGIKTFNGLGQQLRPLYYNSSIVQFITAPLELLVQPAQYPALDKTVRLVFYALFIIYAGIQTHRLWVLGPQADLRDLLTASAKVTFATLALITFWFQPWYIVWLLALGPLSRQPYARRQGVLMSAGALLTYAVSNYLLVNEPGVGRDLFVQFFEALLIFAPLLLLRAAPYEEGWVSIVRRYVGLFTEGFARRPATWQRATLALILVVAALLRLLRLGNLNQNLTGGADDVSVLKQISGDLRLFLADPQGLNGPFVAIQGLLVRLFGPTPLAALLPSAIIGTLTVLVVYFLTLEILRSAGNLGRHGIALLAALLAATSGWHVSLSRSGMQVVMLPLLMCLALYALLRAFNVTHTDAEAQSDAQSDAQPNGEVRATAPRHGAYVLGLFAVAGVSTGLACDLAPGLWLVPMLVLGVTLAWRWRRPAIFQRMRLALTTLVAAALLSGLPALWTAVISPMIGFRVGSDIFARSSEPAAPPPTPFDPAFWTRVGANALDVLKLLITQDYSAGYPAVGGEPIIPPYLGVFFYIGLGFIIYRLIRYRDLTSLGLTLLLALPLVASVAVAAPTGVIEAASVLPATCIVPALAIYEVGLWVGRLPIALDRMNGVRVFTTPEQIGRIALFIFLMASAIRTFYWYFEASLPAEPGNGYTPSSVGMGLALTLGRAALALAGALATHLPGVIGGTLVP